MVHTEKDTVTVTSIADGTGSSQSRPFIGRVLTVRYVKTDYADTVDFVHTMEDSAESLWTELNVTASQTVNPRLIVDDGVGSAIAGEPDYITSEGGERANFAISGAGDTKTGVFVLTIEGSFVGTRE